MILRPAPNARPEDIGAYLGAYRAAFAASCVLVGDSSGGNGRDNCYGRVVGRGNGGHGGHPVVDHSVQKAID